MPSDPADVVNALRENSVQRIRTTKNGRGVDFQERHRGRVMQLKHNPLIAERAQPVIEHGLGHDHRRSTAYDPGVERTSDEPVLHG